MSRKMSLLEILSEALGPDYGPTFRRSLKRQLPRSLWLAVSREKVPVPAADSEEWQELKQAAVAWLVEGARLAWEDLHVAHLVSARRN